MEDAKDPVEIIEYVQAALYVYGPEGEGWQEFVEQNPHGVSVHSVSLDHFVRERANLLAGVNHVVVCASLEGIKTVMDIAYGDTFSIGILPLAEQEQLQVSFGLPKDEDEALSLALRSDSRAVDLVYCNDKILLFKGVVGRVPLIDNPAGTSRWEVFKVAFRQLLSLQLLPFTVSTHGNNKIKKATAASGFLIFENPERSFATKIVGHDFSFADKMVSMVIVAPFSILAYLKLMVLRLFSRDASIRIPDSIGYIKSPHLTIESSKKLNVWLDGVSKTSTPLECMVVSDAIKMNHGQDTSEGGPGKEKAVTRSLPDSGEVKKVGSKRVPFFTYASEDRFKDLFISLRDDAQSDSKYVMLMVLSTFIATLGLFLNSGSVVIGAMLLAPLMAPIISMAMGLLRYDRRLLKKSFNKVCLGIFLALLISSLFTLLNPYQPFTGEMQARTNPTTLDLLVAIMAGIAGAYTKSYKEILQSLAGVAIAVALVPPLAVAGIGLGRLELHIFSNAFLLFLTNLIGIILAATITFRMLGFSPVVHDKRGMTIAVLFLVIISAPLFIAFDSIVDKAGFEKNWKLERFLINEKYLIVNKAYLHDFRNRKVLVVEIHAREPLTRQDLSLFKKKVQQNFSEDLVIRAKIIYIP